ncbi:MAG TPA: alpha/beta hydrolase-fold protein [Solirubrobacteraceae bacterium]
MSGPITPGAGPDRRDEPRTWTRRRVLGYGLGGAVCAAVAGFELVDHGVLPGRDELDRLDGACSVSSPDETLGPVGPSQSASFFSKARNRTVGYTIAYPPGHRPGSVLPLVIALHGYLGNHASALGAVTPAQALAERTGGLALPPMALVTADGGVGYWNAHPGDDPMGMLVDELIPICRELGLGRGHRAIGTVGISMGGYGSLLLAEKHPDLIAGAAAISPAIWTSYAQAHAANAGAFASAAAFAQDDVITHAAALRATPVRVASGTDDPFHPGVEALVRALPASAVVEITKGCHDGGFFASQRPAALAFVGRALA